MILLDKAPYHRSKATQNFLRSVRAPIFFLGPYQFILAPVEKLFAFIKARDLNLLLSKALSKQDSAW